MKKTLLLGLSMLSATAFANGSLTSVEQNSALTSQGPGWQGSVGLGLLTMPEYIGSDNTDSMALPLVNVSYDDTFYMNIATLGAWLYKHESGFRAGVLLTPHMGVDEEDLGNEFIGYGDRDDSIMAGFNLAYQKGMFNAQISYMTDVADKSDGNKFLARANYTMIATRDYTLTVIGNIEAMDSDMVGYYYDDFESTVNYSAGLAGTYSLTGDWSLFAVALHTRLGDEISDSAIGRRDHGTIGILGVTYKL